MSPPSIVYFAFSHAPSLVLSLPLSLYFQFNVSLCRIYALWMLGIEHFCSISLPLVYSTRTYAMHRIQKARIHEGPVKTALVSARVWMFIESDCWHRRHHLNLCCRCANVEYIVYPVYRELFCICWNIVCCKMMRLQMGLWQEGSAKIHASLIQIRLCEWHRRFTIILWVIVIKTFSLCVPYSFKVHSFSLIK